MFTGSDRLLITGVSGLLGNSLAQHFKDKYEVLGLYNSHHVTIKGICTEKCDLTYRDSIHKIIENFKPSVIIHCASLTNIDQCEKDKPLTAAINVLATRNIVKEIIYTDIKIIYISSDAVYDGIKGDFSENDKVNPLNNYGRSKYEGEIEVSKKTNSLILRTNIFGWNIQDKKSLSEWILEELESKHRINCFQDAFFSSIYTMELARVIDIAIQYNLNGIYNCGSSNSCSKYEFAQKIADRFKLKKELLIPISIDDYNFKAKRGKNLSLNVVKLQEDLDYMLPTIDQSIEAFYRDYKCGLPSVIKKDFNTINKKSDSLLIPYGRQWIDENDIQSVVTILRSDRLTQGPKVEEFEKTLAEYCGAKYAVAVNSATSALHIACLAANIGSEDEVITSPITFVASSNCTVYCGARPVFADIDPDTYNVAPLEIEKKFNSRTKAIIPVHFAGQSCDMDSISQIVRTKEKEFNKKIFIIEDACHALGSRYKGNRVGACTFSDMVVMSFHPVKHITTGEGGMVLTNDESLYKRLKLLRSHGITSNPEEFICRDQAFQTAAIGSKPVINPWYYEQVELGYNYRITDIQCALGISQLKKLDEFNDLRRKIITTYNEVFSTIEYIKTPFESKDCDSNFHLYVLRIDFKKLGIERGQFMNELKKDGIQTQVHYIPVYTQPFYQKKYNTNWGDCPNAEKYYQQCLSIPLFPAMSNHEVEKVVDKINCLVQIE